MSKNLGVGIIGCGNISSAYLELAPLFKGYDILAVADINMDNAQERASEFNVRANTVDELLAADDIDLVINLTTPLAHVEVSRAILQAGKHVYSEKPFVLSLEEAEGLSELAKSTGLRIGSAPDTFLGASHQLARKLIDAGTIGTVTSGTAIVMSPGMEDWHPNPDFFFKKGGGPILDLGPYYLCNLVQLLGPVKQVSSFARIVRDTRTIANGPRDGEQVPVETPTTIHALLSFESEAIVTLLASWDVWSNEHPIMELYGSEGTMSIPDPNFFGGVLSVKSRNEEEAVEHEWEHPFAVPNFEEIHANYRGAGLADMALSILAEQKHRCGPEFATHVIEVMAAILTAGETNQVLTMSTSCERPDVLGPEQARALMV